MIAIDTIARNRARFHDTGAGFRRSLIVEIRRATNWLDEVLARRRSRLDLIELTDDQLRDIGVTRREAAHEGNKPFWA